MKSKVDKLSVEKLVAVRADISKLNNLVKNDVVEKTEYDELVKNFTAIQTTDTSNLVKNTIT